MSPVTRGEGRRGLSGIFFRAKVDGKWESVAFEDLPESEQDRVLADPEPEFVRSLAKQLGRRLRQIGDQFDIGVER